MEEGDMGGEGLEGKIDNPASRIAYYRQSLLHSLCVSKYLDSFSSGHL